jgi:hypothetical protein
MAAQDTCKDLIRIVSLMYSSSSASEFRKPVEVSYPSIAKSYRKVVKYPMDLGTLLIHCMKGEASVDKIRRGIQLVFSNSVLFNDGVPMMEAVSRHLETFACGLFEEAIGLPFKDQVQRTAEEFYEERVSKRRQRLKMFCHEHLLESELKALEECIISIDKTVPSPLVDGLTEVLELIPVYIQSLQENKPSGSLKNILEPLVMAAIDQTSRRNSADDSEASTTTATPLLPALAVLVTNDATPTSLPSTLPLPTTLSTTGAPPSLVQVGETPTDPTISLASVVTIQPPPSPSIASAKAPKFVPVLLRYLQAVDDAIGKPSLSVSQSSLVNAVLLKTSTEDFNAFTYSESIYHVAIFIFT